MTTCALNSNKLCGGVSLLIAQIISRQERRQSVKSAPKLDPLGHISEGPDVSEVDG